MTSPFVDRVEYQVIGRDVNASGVFRDVASAADAAGDSITGLGSDLDRVNRSIDDTADRMRELLSSIQDLTATRQITITTNVREVLGSVEDNRQVLDLINDRFESLTVNVIATVNQLVQLNDGLVTIDDSRTAVIDLGDDVLTLTQNIDATVDSVVELNDGITTIDDNRAAVVTLGDDVLTLTQNIDATVDAVVELNDGITTIDDNRDVVVTVGDDFRTLNQTVDATVDAVVELNDGITTIDDNRAAITGVGDDFRTLSDDVESTRQVVIRFNDEVATVDDNRPAVANLGTGFDDLSTAIERSRGRVNDLNRDIGNLPGGRDIDNDIDVTRQVVETVSSSRDRLERAGLIAGAVLGHAMLTSIGNILAGGIVRIPFIGPFLAAAGQSIAAASPQLAIAITAALSIVAVAAAGVVVNAFTAGILAALGGGVLAVGMIAAFSDPVYMEVLKGVGSQIKETFTDAVKDSGFTAALIDGLNLVTQALRDMKPVLTDVFSNAAPLIRPLTEGMLGFAKNILPGISVALKNMKPIFDQLAVSLPKLGSTLGEFFAKLSTMSPQLASALGYVLGFVDTMIQFIGGLLIAMAKLEPVFEDVLQRAKMFFDLIMIVKPGFALIDLLLNLWELLKLLGDVATIAADGIRILWDELTNMAAPLANVVSLLGGVSGPLSTFGTLAGIAANAMGLFGGKSEEAGSQASGLGGVLGGAAGALAEAGAKAATAAGQQDKYAKAIRDSINAANDFIRGKDQVAGAYEALDRAAQHLADTTGTDLKKGIDLTTAAGRDNWRVLADIAGSANAAAGQIGEMGGTTEDVAGVLRDARQKFLETANAMGITGQRAIDLANQMFGIPDVDPTVTLQDKASAGIGSLNGQLGALDRYNAMPSVGLLDNATSQIGRVQTLLYRLDGNSATVYVNVRQNGSVSNPVFAASGGPVYGPGPKGVDSKLYMLAPGEHILTAPEVDAAGGHSAIMEFRRSLLNKANPPRLTASIDEARSARSGGGIDASTLRRALSGMTLVIDDRTGRTAQLIARGG